MKLVIVESPTKSHTISHYLGEDYVVEASIGHIRDLAKSGKGGFGVDIENNFKPTYVVLDDKKDVINVVVVPCTAKKFEIRRTEMGMDIAITTSELVLLLKEEGINLLDVKETDFDLVFPKGSGSGVIFGRSAGVMEAILRCFNYLVTGKDKIIEVKKDNEKVSVTDVKIGPYDLKVAVIRGMIGVEQILPNLEMFDFIEVMNCPSGCVSGGGQILRAINRSKEINEKRTEALSNDDNNLDNRFCYKNETLINIYKNYLDYPNSPKALKLLHTNFKDRSSILKEETL